MQKNLQLNSTLRLKPKSKTELAGEYQVTRATVARWCIALEIKTRQLLNVHQVAKIYEEKGVPGNYEQQMTLNFE